MVRKLKSLWVLPVVVLLVGCSVQKAAITSNAGATARFPELELKEKLQREAASKAMPLKLQRAIKNGQGAEFIVPAGITYSDSGDLYVSDNNAHTVHLWPSRSAASGELRAGAEAAQLKFPNPVQVRGDKLFVADSDGIKVLSLNGRFERLIRPYFTIQDFAVTDKGTIVACVLIRNSGAQDPLIVEMDQTGKVVRRIGVRRAAAGQDDYENQAFIAVSGSRLVVAYRYRPFVEVYDLDSGKLVRGFEVNHPVFQALKNLPTSASTTTTTAAEQKLDPRYLAGVKCVGDRIFLCLHLPRPEIWEVNAEGKLLAAFRAEGLPPAIHIFGFDARLSDEELNFAIGIVDSTLGTSVSELSATIK
jgi:hypothetical protein